MAPGTFPEHALLRAQAMVGPSPPSPALKVMCCQNRTHNAGHFRAKEKAVWADRCQGSHSQPPAPERMEGTEAPVLFFEGRAVFIHHTGF